MISHVTIHYCISPIQIYAAGKFVGDLACNPTASSQIAAFAAAPLAWYIPNNSSMTITPPSACNPSRLNVLMLEIPGGKDTRIVYQGGLDKNRPGLVTEAPAWLQQWVAWDECVQGNLIKPLKGSFIGGGEVNVTTWRCGPDGQAGSVSYYFSERMAHVWPTGGNAGFNGTTFIMNFFGRWRGSE